MELEGLGVSLLGRFSWLYGTNSIPWEFLQIQQNHGGMKILIRGFPQPSFVESESEWTTAWHPTHTRDWSCIATILRSIGTGSCLLVFESVQPPATFWTFLESLCRDGRTVLTRVWIHTEAPPLVPDATFFAPTRVAEECQQMLDVFTALPARAGHGGWRIPSGNWVSIVEAAYEQGMGLVVTDLEEHDWTLLWHRPADSRPSVERRIPTAQHWLRIGMQCLGS
jgi:hypothetical protein